MRKPLWSSLYLCHKEIWKISSMQTKTTHITVRHPFPVPPIWVAGVLLLSWLGFWVHEFFRVPAQVGFTLESTLFHLLPALIIFSYLVAFPPEHFSHLWDVGAGNTPWTGGRNIQCAAIAHLAFCP